MFYFSYLPEGNELSYWIIYTGSAAILLVSIAIITFIWSLLRARRVWRFTGLFLLMLIVGCWSLRIVFTGFQQLSFLQRYIKNNPEATIYQPGSADATFNAYTEACQFWFGIVVAAFAILAILGIWWLIHRSRERRKISHLAETVTSQ